MTPFPAPRHIVLRGIALLALTLAPHAIAQHAHGQGQPAAGSQDARRPVTFPGPLKEQTQSNMRDHLLALTEIQDALGRSDFERAADVAEQRLGMTSLTLHGAHDVAPYMPEGMQNAGTAMHRSASRFASIAQETAVDRNVPRAIAALGEVTRSCVTCHAAYRLE